MLSLSIAQLIMAHLSTASLPSATTLCSAILLGLALLQPRGGHAQGYAEGISLSYEALPLRLGTGTEAHFRAAIYRASLISPIAMAADSSRSLLVGASMETLRFSGERPGFGAGSVFGFSPILGYRRRLSANAELTALALPALNSDLRDVRFADVTWGGVGRLVYRHSPRLATRLTLGYRQQFYGPQYVLLLGLDWRPAARWRVFGDLPTSLTVSYRATPRLNAGFNLSGINTAYRLQLQDQYLQYQQGHYGLFAEAGLRTHWVLRGTIAYAVTRRIGVYARDQQWPATIDYIGLGAAPLPSSPPLTKGPALKLALSYRIAGK